MLGLAAGDGEIASGDSPGDDERSRFDAVRNDAVLSAAELGDTMNGDGGSSGAADLRAHLIEEVGKIGDFGFTRAVFHHGLAFGKRGGHHEVFSTGDGDL